LKHEGRLRYSIRQCKGDQGATPSAAGLFKFLQKLGFEIVGIDFHFAAGDLLVSRTVKTELADAQPAFGPDRWSERPTGNRSRRIELTGSGCWIERRTGFFVGKTLEPLFCVHVFREHASLRIAGELW
jgi:hypothetical protein